MKNLKHLSSMAHSFLDAQKNITNPYKNFDIDVLLSN